jgi:hypothetical protein
MRPVNQQITIEARHRTLLTLWFALTVSIGMFFLFTILRPLPEQATPNPVLSLTFLVVGMLAVIASYLIKQWFLARSVHEQNVMLVHMGMVVAGAISEVAAILGVMDYLLTGHRHYYVLLIVSLIGSLLNFPRRSHLEAASYKSSQPKDPWK